MARIELENKKERITFEELEEGTCFIANDEAYMKIDLLLLDDEDVNLVNAIMLETGEGDYFDDDTLIIADKIYNTIQLKKE